MKYWNGKGKHQKVYDSLIKELVPDYGNADTEAGEMLRVLGNVYYDVYNNGGCNLNEGRKEDLDQLAQVAAKTGFRGNALFIQLRGMAEAADQYEVDATLDNKSFQKRLDELVDHVVIQAQKRTSNPTPRAQRSEVR